MKDNSEHPLTGLEAAQERPATPYDFRLESLSDTVAMFYYKQPESHVPIRRWEIQRAVNGDFNSKLLENMYSLDIPFKERRRTWEGMKPDTAYGYRVRSRGVNDVVSLWSAPVYGHTLGAGGVPSTPKNLRVAVQTEDRLGLAWDASSAATEITQYTVYRNGKIVSRLPGNLTSYHDSGLAPDTVYEYAVTAHDRDGQVSALSVPLSARTERSEVYRSWQLNQWYEVDMIVSHQNRLWVCLQGHYAYSPDWAPGLDGIEVLWDWIG